MRSDLEKCKTCYHKYHKKWEAGICDYYDKCEDNEKYKRYTNGDAIRQMSDEGIASLLCDMSKDCGLCHASYICSPGHNGFKKWIKQTYI